MNTRAARIAAAPATSNCRGNCTASSKPCWVWTTAQRPNRISAATPHPTPRPHRSPCPLQVAQFYNFPPGNGAGQTIALIELGGGYNPADLTAYFSEIGVSPAPSVTAVSVDQATNAPTGSADGPDGEVLLDIEIAGAIAPGAAIAVYFAPNTDAGFLDAVTTAAHDTVNKPSIISISWGGPESSWTAQSTSAFDSAFQAARRTGHYRAGCLGR